MNARELRIGNLIHYNETQLRVACNTIEDLIRDNINGRTDRFTPIPLSSEWLERFTTYKMPHWKGAFGFQKQPHAVEFAGDALGWRFIYRGDHLIGDYLKYVHQLQNLYFALTGSELELKPVKETQ